MIAVVRNQYVRLFEKLCNENDVVCMATDRNAVVTVYETYGDPTMLYMVGVGVGIEIGEQNMWDACMTINDN
jgi:hypothetical protein